MVSPKYENCTCAIRDNVEKTVDVSGVLFGSNGKPITKGDFAARQSNGKFYVKVNKKNKLFNPHNPDRLLEDKRMVNGNDPVYFMFECNEECFKYYKLFLERNIDSYFNMAQKEIVDGGFKTKHAYTMSQEHSMLVNTDIEGLRPIDAPNEAPIEKTSETPKKSTKKATKSRKKSL